MFNTLANTVANCPHCKKSSSVGARYARTRALAYAVCSILTVIVLLSVAATSLWKPTKFEIIILIGLSLMSIFFIHRLVYFIRLKISQVLGPI